MSDLIKLKKGDVELDVPQGQAGDLIAKGFQEVTVQVQATPKQAGASKTKNKAEVK